jgi:integrase
LRNEHYVSPVVRGMERNDKGARSRILNDDEIRALWQAAGDCGAFGALCKVAVLTAQRREKIATMRRKDIDADGVWTIPTDAREKGNIGVVQLPSMVLDIINAQPRIAGNPYIFPAARGTKPFSSFSDGKAALDDKMPKEIPQWQLHDLRRTARSLLSRAGVLPHVSEQVLGHKLQGVEGIYDRYSYAHEKADALQRLAALVDRILNPPTGNVVTMARKRQHHIGLSSAVLVFDVIEQRVDLAPADFEEAAIPPARIDVHLQAPLDFRL